jgi:predicted nucleic acid-binding protein
MVVFDTTFLSQLLYEKSRPPLDHSTKQPIERAKERIEYLIEKLNEGRQKIIIPTPVLTELLAVSNNPQELLERISSSRWFEIYPFDQKAAIECAEFIRAAKKPHEKKEFPSTWAKAKFDYQIIAAAIVVGADTIYTDDEDIHRLLIGKRIKAIRISGLPLPPPKQMSLPDTRDIEKG